ncbi:hypothetical protein EG327_001307 [Venturia inaequalis]|uniref:Rhodopsin domain-containing protein n=1 Tax=Venturia inaequalis TaxID=5025 RepID=A0A8H3VMQ3_VENIN|nr:hypothetical protein EG327_001307 [Venturia inaequalis]
MPKSALIGYPPATDHDYWIAKYMIRTLGIENGDPSQGFKVSPPRPPAGEYQFETRGPGLIAGLSICLVVMAGITGLRLYLRFFTPRLKSGLDDWLIIPGVILALAYPALQLAMVTYGGSGKHIYDCTYEEQYVFKYLAAIAQVLFFVSLGFVKLSITAFNMRLTGFSSKNWMIAHWTFFMLIVCYTLVALALTVFPCDPIWATFDIARLGKLDKLPKSKECLRTQDALVEIGKYGGLHLDNGGQDTDHFLSMWKRDSDRYPMHSLVFSEAQIYNFNLLEN